MLAPVKFPLPQVSVCASAVCVVSLFESCWLQCSACFPADCSGGRARDLQAVASDGDGKTILHIQAFFTIPLPPVSM